MDLVAVHARHIEAARSAGCIEHRIIAAASRAKTEVVTHQHIAGCQRPHQHVIDEGLWRLPRKPFVKRQDHAFVDTAVGEFRELVAQRGDARRRDLGAAERLREMVARMRLEGHRAARQPAVLRLIAQQRDHGLMAAVHAVEVADGERARMARQPVVEASVDFHGWAVARKRRRRGVVECRYIVFQSWVPGR